MRGVPCTSAQHLIKGQSPRDESAGFCTKRTTGVGTKRTEEKNILSPDPARDSETSLYLDVEIWPTYDDDASVLVLDAQAKIHFDTAFCGTSNQSIRQ